MNNRTCLTFRVTLPEVIVYSHQPLIFFFSFLNPYKPLIIITLRLQNMIQNKNMGSPIFFYEFEVLGKANNRIEHNCLCSYNTIEVK